MSIIHDALKKTQHQLDKSKRATRSKPLHKESPIIPSIDKINRHPVIRPTPPPSMVAQEIQKFIQTPAKPTKSTTPINPSPHPLKRQHETTLNPPYQRSKNLFRTWSIILFLIATLLAIEWHYLNRYTNNPLPFVQPSRTPLTTSQSFDKKSPSDATLKLNGTMIMSGQRVALINGEMYEIGEHINEKEIVHIAEKEVHLQNAQGRLILNLRH